MRFSCQVVANQSWNKGSKGRYSMVDVSEGESFLWVGKTTHKIASFKPNVSKLIKRIYQSLKAREIVNARDQETN